MAQEGFESNDSDNFVALRVQLCFFFFFGRGLKRRRAGYSIAHRRCWRAWLRAVEGLGFDGVSVRNSSLGSAGLIGSLMPLLEQQNECHRHGHH